MRQLHNYVNNNLVANQQKNQPSFMPKHSIFFGPLARCHVFADTVRAKRRQGRRGKNWPETAQICVARGI